MGWVRLRGWGQDEGLESDRGAGIRHKGAGVRLGGWGETEGLRSESKGVG